jgi:hypothetical protein
LTETLLELLDDASYPLPVYDTVTATEPVTWSTLAIVHEAAPEELVVAVQDWADLPVPSVMVTVCPLRPVPLFVSVADSVADDPAVTLVGPVYVMLVGAALTTKLLDPLLASSAGDVLVLPAKDPDRLYVPDVSVGVTEHEPLPLLPVVAVQDWVPFRVSVIVWPLMPCPVTLLVNVPVTVVGCP